MEKLVDIVTWLGNVLTAIVKGIKGTYTYWDKRKDELEDLTKE